MLSIVDSRRGAEMRRLHEQFVSRDVHVALTGIEFPSPAQIIFFVCFGNQESGVLGVKIVPVIRLC